jgi:hypothetical protein
MGATMKIRFYAFKGHRMVGQTLKTYEFDYLQADKAVARLADSFEEQIGFRADKIIYRVASVRDDQLKITDVEDVKWIEVFEASHG